MLTDEHMAYVTEKVEVIGTIKTRNPRHNATFFMYTMGQSKSTDGGMPKIVACATNGVWSPVPNDRDLLASMSAFTKFYSLGLGKTSTYTYWSEPYAFVVRVFFVGILCVWFDEWSHTR